MTIDFNQPQGENRDVLNRIGFYLDFRSASRVRQLNQAWREFGDTLLRQIFERYIVIPPNVSAGTFLSEHVIFDLTRLPKLVEEFLKNSTSMPGQLLCTGLGRDEVEVLSVAQFKGETPPPIKQHLIYFPPNFMMAGVDGDFSPNVVREAESTGRLYIPENLPIFQVGCLHSEPSSELEIISLERKDQEEYWNLGFFLSRDFNFNNRVEVVWLHVDNPSQDLYRTINQVGTKVFALFQTDLSKVRCCRSGQSAAEIVNNALFSNPGLGIGLTARALVQPSADQSFLNRTRQAYESIRDRIESGVARMQPARSFVVNNRDAVQLIALAMAVAFVIQVQQRYMSE